MWNSVGLFLPIFSDVLAVLSDTQKKDCVPRWVIYFLILVSEFLFFRGSHASLQQQDAASIGQKLPKMNFEFQHQI